MLIIDQMQNSRYGESALTNKSFYIEEQDHKPRASEVLDPGAHLWKSNNIWGNGDFSSRIFGRKHREPLAVTGIEVFFLLRS